MIGSPIMMTLLSSLALLSLLTASVMGQAWKGELHSDLPLLLKKPKAGDAEAMAEYAFHSMRCMGGPLSPTIDKAR